jgi:hypothetical protein
MMMHGKEGKKRGANYNAILMQKSYFYATLCVIVIIIIIIFDGKKSLVCV